MDSHNQDPNLRSKYDRRAKLAAWTAGLSLFGAAAVETVNAQPAAAGSEIAQQAEQSPQAFINRVDKRLATEVQMMRSSPYYSSLDAHKYIKSLPPGTTFEYVGAPSKQHPGRYDWLAVTMVKGKSMPINASIDMGTRSKTYTGINGVYESGYLFGQAINSSGKPKDMVLEADHAYDALTHFFTVSSEGYPARLIPRDSVRYSNNPAKVAAEFNAFLNQVHDITTRR